MRGEELREALHALAPGHEIVIERAGLTDGNSTSEAAQPQFLERARNFARRFGPAAVWCTWHGDPHCDHQAAACVARAIARDLTIPCWSFAVWGRFGEGVVPSSLCAFRDERFMPAKARAIAAYRSQLTNLIDDDPRGFVMPPAMVEHFRSHAEIFIDG